MTGSAQRQVPLSVLDLAVIPTGSSIGEALRHTIALAQHVERLGYTRFWLAEHHNMPSIASAATSILIGQVAAATESIRVGSGGIMLPNHASLVIAEQFGTLDALFPGRIDLGIGRAPGTDGATARALRRSAAAMAVDDFPQQLLDLRSFFSGDFPVGHPFKGITAVPGRGADVPIWLLGSSTYSAQAAAAMGLPFAFAHHFSAQAMMPALQAYHQHFRPSATLAKPYVIVATGVVCAETDERARWLARPGELMFAWAATGRHGTVPSPEAAAAHACTAQETAIIEMQRADRTVGSPATVRKKLDALLALPPADEIMVMNQIADHTDRV
ncbi:MAG: LLM class flavin-dependent oxidoreductase, partial [Candidatus Sericytochromatia bacterium]|nr:LLM class flavin-dependent oxidoreductase [Candidatus Sericytochromatia bacterium]